MTLNYNIAIRNAAQQVSLREAPTPGARFVRPSRSMNPVAQPSRLRVRAASHRLREYEARRPIDSQARTPALLASSERGPLSPLVLEFRNLRTWLSALLSPCATHA